MAAETNGTAVASKLTPLGDRVVIKPAGREEMTKSGIVLPDTAKEKPQRGTIIAAGQGRRDDDGERIPLAQGEAAIIRRGEIHSKGSETGRTAFMVQVHDLTPLRR